MSIADEIGAGVRNGLEGAVPNVVGQVFRELDAMGLVVVPREPTKAMIDAGNRAGFKASVHTVSADVYRAMIAAAPKREK